MIPTGITATAKLFTIGSDTVAETIGTLTEATNRKGTAVGTVTVTGWHKVVVFNGSTPVGDFIVYVGSADPGTYTAVDDDGANVHVPRVLDRIDYQRGHHTATGQTFYVDGTGGNDSTGTGTRGAPWKTISKALTAVTNNAHDEIILLPNSGGGPTTITEASTINIASKNHVQIRGPGRDVRVTLSGAGNVFNITSNGVELSGFRISTNSGGSSSGIVIASSADFVRLTRLWVDSAHQDGIQLNVANNCVVDYCTITGPVRDGIRVTSGAGSGQYNVFTDNTIRGATGNGILMQGADASYCRAQRNTVRDCTTGVNIGSGAIGCVVTDNRLANNTTNVSDSGTSTQVEWNLISEISTGTAGTIAAAVWDLDATSHQTQGTFGQVLGDSGATASSVWGLANTNLDATVSSRLSPTVAGRTLDVSATGEAGIDWANVGSPTTTVGLSNTTIKTATDVETDTADIQTRIPAALTGAGNMKADALAINGSTLAATITAAINGSLKTGTVDDATFSPTSTAFETDILTDSDEFSKQTILWTGGLNAGFFSRVLSYAFTNSKVKLTLSEALPNVPVDGDTFAVTSRIE